MNVLVFGKHFEHTLPKKYQMHRKIKELDEALPTLVIDTRFADIDAALAFARRIDTRSEAFAIFAPKRNLSKLHRVLAWLFRVVLQSTLEDAFAGYFVILDTSSLKRCPAESWGPLVLDLLVTVQRAIHIEHA